MQDKKDGIFINGREQALEILRMLSPEERSRILNNINLRNQSLASDLKQNSVSEKDMESYPISSYNLIFNRVKPEVLGLALQQTDKNFQRHILKSAERSYAEKAFKTLMMEIPQSKLETIKRAKRIVLTELVQV